jgi:two-component system, OmpR family, heavy metal sensor histidine kinase CusS
LQVDSTGSWRVIAVRDYGPDGLVTVKVGRSLASFEQESRELLFTFILTGPLTLLIAVSGGYFLARRALAPVQAITQTARQISVERLSERIVLDNPDDELGTLSATLNEMIERLERSFAEMRRFTADAAHELRTPLAVIRNEAEVALRAARSPEEYRRALENLLEEANGLSALTDQLLFLSRQDTGLRPRSDESVDVTGLLAELVSNMQPLARENNVVLTLEACPPHSQIEARLTSDSRLLRRVFYNLLDNAIKYTAATGTVSVTTRMDDGHLIVTVLDSGIGIPAEHLPRIFERFYRVDPSRSGEANGTGLGLSICQSIVRGMGGEIHVESSFGRGSEFIVRIPWRPGAGVSSLPQEDSSFKQGEIA